MLRRKQRPLGQAGPRSSKSSSFAGVACRPCVEFAGKEACAASISVVVLSPRHLVNPNQAMLDLPGSQRRSDRSLSQVNPELPAVTFVLPDGPAPQKWLIACQFNIKRSGHFQSCIEHPSTRAPVHPTQQDQRADTLDSSSGAPPRPRAARSRSSLRRTLQRIFSDLRQASRPRCADVQMQNGSPISLPVSHRPGYQARRARRAPHV